MFIKKTAIKITRFNYEKIIYLHNVNFYLFIFECTILTGNNPEIQCLCSLNFLTTIKQQIKMI